MACLPANNVTVSRVINCNFNTVAILQKLTPEELASKFSSYTPILKDIISGNVKLPIAVTYIYYSIIHIAGRVP